MKKYIFIFISLLLISCSKNEKLVDVYVSNLGNYQNEKALNRNIYIWTDVKVDKTYLLFDETDRVLNMMATKKVDMTHDMFGSLTSYNIWEDSKIKVTSEIHYNDTITADVKLIIEDK